ncbi:VTT domain-containing protein [Saccharopolyspora gloriosae]|uniref:Membrane protein DedA with SNARE-associated domain n=1 Tax=Saccharopolyspora gloriosae TaxID=455344 RepID=A0A840NPX4_9PSEU|nr:membrane protein DedA with SNARE-associated domain [Saccharopolyspora gloriosae]
MSDAVLDLVHAAMGSPWIYLALVAYVALDAVLPSVPGEVLVVTCGVFAMTGTPNLAGVIAAGAAGGFAGDHLAYLLGRRAGGALLTRLPPGSRRRRPFEWARRALARRGGSILIVCRFVPGCRTAAAMTAGTIGMPLRLFSGCAALGATAYSAYFTLVGCLGGAVFRDHPLPAVLLGIGSALVIAGVVELIRLVLRGRSARRAEPERVPVGVD